MINSALYPSSNVQILCDILFANLLCTLRYRVRCILTLEDLSSAAIYPCYNPMMTSKLPDWSQPYGCCPYFTPHKSDTSRALSLFNCPIIIHLSSGLSKYTVQPLGYSCPWVPIYPHLWDLSQRHLTLVITNQPTWSTESHLLDLLCREDPSLVKRIILAIQLVALGAD